MQKLSIMTVSMILPLCIVTLFLLPFMTFKFDACLTVEDTLPNFISFNFVMILFTVTWSLLFVSLCLACCCACCESDIVQIMLCVVLAGIFVFSGVIGLIVLWSSTTDVVFVELFYMFCVASVQLWMNVCLTRYPQCRCDDCYNLKQMKQQIDDHESDW